VRLALLLAAAVILIRDPTGKWAGDPLRDWFKSLQGEDGLYCCAQADGHPLDDGEWDMKGDSYRVTLCSSPEAMCASARSQTIAFPNLLGP